MKTENIELVVVKPSELKDIMKALKDSEVFYNPDGITIGAIENIEVLERQNKDKQVYNQIQINVKDLEGKSFNKRYSVEFTRKYFKQLGKKAADMGGATVVFKPTGKFKQIGWWAFVIKDGEGFNIAPYIDEGSDFSKKLVDLGL